MPPKQRDGGHKRWNLVLKPDTNTESEKHDIFTDMPDNLYTDKELQIFLKPREGEKDVRVYQSIKIDGIAGLVILLVAKKADHFQCIPFNNSIENENLYYSVYQKTAQIDLDSIKKSNDDSKNKKKLDNECWKWLESLKNDHTDNNISNRVLHTEEFIGLDVTNAPTNCTDTTNFTSESLLQHLKLLLAIGAPDYFVWKHKDYFFKFMMLDQTDCVPITTSLNMQIQIFDELIGKLDKAGFDITKNVGRWIVRVEKILPDKGHRSNQGQRNIQILKNDSDEDLMEDESSITKNLLASYHNALNKNNRFSLVMLQDMDSHVKEDAWKCFVNKDVQDVTIINLTEKGNIFPHLRSDFKLPVIGEEGEGSELKLVENTNVMFVPYSRTLKTDEDFESCFKRSREMAVTNGLEGFVLHRTSDKRSQKFTEARKLKFVQEKICLKSLLNTEKSEPWKVSTYCKMSVLMLFDVHLPIKYILDGTTLLRVDNFVSTQQQYNTMPKQSKQAQAIKTQLNRRENCHPIARLCVDNYPVFRKNFKLQLHETDIPNSVLSMHHVRYYACEKDKRSLVSTLPDNEGILNNLKQWFLLEEDGHEKEISSTELSDKILLGLRTAHNIVFERDTSSISLDIQTVLKKIQTLQNNLSYFKQENKIEELMDQTQWVNILSESTEVHGNDEMEQDELEHAMQEDRHDKTKLNLSTPRQDNNWFYRLFTWFEWNIWSTKAQSPSQKTLQKGLSLFSGKNSEKKYIFYNLKSKKRLPNEKNKSSMVASVADGVMISNVNTTFAKGENYVSSTSNATAKLRTSVTEGARSNMRSLTDSLNPLSSDTINRPQYTQIVINDIFLECYIIMLVVAALDVETFDFKTAGESFSNTLRRILIELVVSDAKKKDQESETNVYAQNIQDMIWPEEGWLNRINASRKKIYDFMHDSGQNDDGDSLMIDESNAPNHSSSANGSSSKDRNSSSKKTNGQNQKQKQTVLKISLTPENKCEISKLWQNKLQEKMKGNSGLMGLVTNIFNFTGNSPSISREGLLKHYNTLSKDLNLKNYFTVNSFD